MVARNYQIIYGGRSDMCKFCENIGIGIPKWDFCNEKSPNYSGIAIEIRNITNNPSLVFTNSADEYGAGALSINYCPICGRKLV
jgi:hypothetical protein